MFYKKCNTCTNKTCEQTKTICDSMERYLQDNVEVAQQHKLADTSNGAMRLHGLGELENNRQEDLTA